MMEGQFVVGVAAARNHTVILTKRSVGMEAMKSLSLFDFYHHHCLSIVVLSTLVE